MMDRDRGGLKIFVGARARQKSSVTRSALAYPHHCRSVPSALPSSVTVRICTRGAIAGILVGGFLTGGIVPRSQDESGSLGQSSTCFHYLTDNGISGQWLASRMFTTRCQFQKTCSPLATTCGDTSGGPFIPSHGDHVPASSLAACGASALSIEGGNAGNSRSRADPIL